MSAPPTRLRPVIFEGDVNTGNIIGQKDLSVLRGYW